MSPIESGAIQIFVSPTGAGDADGSRDRPFSSLREALGALGDRWLGSSAAGEQATVDRPVEILYTDGRVSRSNGTRKPTYQYFVDTVPLRGEGDGSSLAPWPTIGHAIDGIGRLHTAGARPLRVGQRICIRPRGVFTATPFEYRRRRHELGMRILFQAMTLGLVMPVIGILGYLVYRAWPALSAEFIFTNPKDFMTAGGVWAPLVGTYFLVLISLLVAAPIGILAGVYLNEYAGENWLTRIINLAVVNLAGVPSIVHALFGVGAFVLFAHMGESVLAAACTLAVMTLPVIITSTREAMASVPISFREACWNMGASRWQTIRTIVLPNSLSGILTGLILQVARAAGETAPIMFTGAVFFTPIADSGWKSFFPYGLHDRCMALSMHLFTLSTQVANVHETVIYGTAVVLIGLVLAVNSLAIVLRVYLRSRKKW